MKPESVISDPDVLIFLDKAARAFSLGIHG
jgi:hypothetical protein